MREEKPNGYEAHRIEQQRHLYLNTTAEERLEWLEETLFFLWRNGLLKSQMPEEPQDS